MKPVAVAVALAGVLALSACGTDKGTEQFKDADRGSSNTDPADTITFPDGFSNVAHKCDGPNMVYVLFKGDAAYGSLHVVPNDPRCGTR